MPSLLGECAWARSWIGGIRVVLPCPSVSPNRWEDWHCCLLRLLAHCDVSRQHYDRYEVMCLRLGMLVVSLNESSRSLLVCPGAAPALGHNLHEDQASCALCTHKRHHCDRTIRTMADRGHISPSSEPVSAAQAWSRKNRSAGSTKSQGQQNIRTTIVCTFVIVSLSEEQILIPLLTFLCLHNSHLGISLSAVVLLLD